MMSFNEIKEDNVINEVASTRLVLQQVIGE